MATSKALIDTRELRRGKRSRDHFLRVFKVVGVVRAVFTVGENGGESSAASARAARALLVVGAAGRHRPQPNAQQGPDIDANLHSRRTAEDINSRLLRRDANILEAQLVPL